MSHLAPRARYESVRAALVHALAQSDRWSELPRLMDELDQARHGEDGPPAGGSPRQVLWVDRFAATLLDGGAPAPQPEPVQRAALSLWPWLGGHDPVAIARGQWDELPRSYA